jgi:hypothetical protein
MTLRKINARDVTIQVALVDGTTWVEVGGLNSATPKLAENEESVDTTTFSSQGNYEGEIMQRGASLALEGFVLKDDITGAPNPGQDRCTQLALLTGYASLGKIRFRAPVDTNWTVWNEATFSVGEQGGGNNDKISWKCDIMRSGPSVLVSVS